MRWPLLLFVGWLTIFPRVTWADDPGDPHHRANSPLPLPLPDPLPHPTLLQQNPAAHFSLILGRLQLDPVRYRKGSQTLLRTVATSASPATQAASFPREAPATVTETLHVNSVRGNPTVHYSLISGSTKIAIDADARGPWRLETQKATSSRTSTRVVVEQRPGEALRLQHFSDQPTRTLRAATWLHLREADHSLFAAFLTPVLNELLAPYDFDELADAALKQSIHQSSNQAVPDTLLSEWIADLGSPRRAVRMQADRALQDVGISLLPRLASLDASRLDAEQRLRVAKIRDRLTPRAEDSAATLALLIRDDVHYWALANKRLDSAERFLVQSRIRRLDGLVSHPDSDSVRIATESSTMRR